MIKSRGSVFLTGGDHGGGVPVGLMKLGVEDQYDGWNFIDPVEYWGTLIIQVWAKHIVHGAVASLVDCIAFRMVQEVSILWIPNAFSSSSHTRPVNSRRQSDKSCREQTRVCLYPVECC